MERVRDTGRVQGGVVLVDFFLRDAPVGATEQSQDWVAGRRGRSDRVRPGLVAWHQPTVEADRAGQAEPLPGLQERLRATEAKTHCEQRGNRHVLPQPAGRGRHVGGYLRRRGRLHVRHEVEVRRAMFGACRTSEVVDRDRVDSEPGETFGELLVEREQSTDVGQHDDPCASVRLGARLGIRAGGRTGRVRSELGAVRGPQCQCLSGHVGTPKFVRELRRQSVRCETHPWSSFGSIDDRLHHAEPTPPRTRRPARRGTSKAGVPTRRSEDQRGEGQRRRRTCRFSPCAGTKS